MKRNIIKLHRGTITKEQEQIGDSKKKRQEEERAFYRVAYESLGLGMSIALPIVLGVLVGSFVDSRLNKTPLFVILFLILGILLSGFSLVNTIKKLEQ